MASFDVSTGAAYAVLYSVLAFFTLLALASAGWFSACLPNRATACCTLKQQPQEESDSEGDGDSDDDEKKQQEQEQEQQEQQQQQQQQQAGSKAMQALKTDHFLSARNSAGMWAIALSFFASGMGAWVLYGTTEMGATPALSWIGVIGYSLGSALPALVICWIGPCVRVMSSSTQAFSTTDFGRKRYGRVMQVVIACVSGFYMFIYIVAELTAISFIFALLTNDYSSIYGIIITVSLGAFTVLYTTIAGLPASIVTDKFQGIIVAILVIMLSVAVSVHPENQFTSSDFARASNWTVEGVYAAVTLIIAIMSAELFNQGTWQRVWAAKSVPAMRRGFALGSVLVFILMMFFGVMGMIAYANDPEAYDKGLKVAFLAFFDLLEPLQTGWHILTLILVTALAASSVDSLQNGLSSIFSRDLIKFGWNPQWITRILMVAINVPAIYLASKRYDVLQLFLVADIVCATSVFPVFLGLQTNDKWTIFRAPTEIGAFFGSLSGIITVVVIGIVVDAEGGVFEYFWLRNGAICTLCGVETMVTFIITPAVSLVMTYLFSYADIMIRGDRARAPIFPLAFDEDNDETEEKSNSPPQNETFEFDEDEEYEEEENLYVIHEKYIHREEEEERIHEDDDDEDILSVDTMYLNSVKNGSSWSHIKI